MTNSRNRSINAIRNERQQRRLNNNIIRDASKFERVKAAIQENRDQEERDQDRDDREREKSEREERKNEREKIKKNEREEITFTSTSEKMINFMMINEELFQIFYM